ncbi:MAG: DUF882 domain-containing protein [Pseudolabrys sp.]|nr:DUF882 domain-containing protein [Pseudolabrys sp.]
MILGRNSRNLSVSVRRAPRHRKIASPTRRSLRRAGISLGASLALAGVMLLGANLVLQPASAEGDNRTLSFLHLHTRETITITYKRNGRYDQDALKKLDWFMRDWRKNEDVKMDPKLFDILWEVYREVGATQPIEVICGYRAPSTNNMLRARSSGVAENSNHTTGHAMDFEIPGVPLAKIREVGLRLQRGGVGFYPTSGSPFVHLDTGTIRHWPRMTREQLVKVFPDERTVHIPSDGKPLAGYALALADVERRGNEPSRVIMAQAREAGITAADVAEARAEAPAGKPRNLLASLFGGSSKSETPEAKPEKAPVVLASAKPKPVATASIVPLPSSRPRVIQVASAEPAPQTAANVIATRSGVWTSAVESGDLAPTSVQSPFTFADTMTTASLPQAALAYAAAPTRTAAADIPPLPRPARARPMGVNVPAAPPTAGLMPQAQAAVASAAPASITGGGQRADSPWLRAAVLTPNLTTHMSTTHMGDLDTGRLAHLFQKPAQSLMMSFSADPGLGIVADRFTGHAVVFLATASFVTQTTASLR